MHPETTARDIGIKILEDILVSGLFGTFRSTKISYICKRDTTQGITVKENGIRKGL
jgi:hypothetical protein